MTAKEVANWMLAQVKKHGCIYQDDVVDYLVKAGAGSLLRENSVGNLVLGRTVLKEFKEKTKTTVVWVRPNRYWRWRVTEDEPGRDAGG